MHITKIIKRPILTEKTYNKISKGGIYVFEVMRIANKSQIKKAFETIFEVKIKKINTLNVKPKFKKMGKFIGKTNYVKKAIITLKSGETINLLNENKESK